MKTRHKRKRTTNRSKKTRGGFLFGNKSPPPILSGSPPVRPINMTYENQNISNRFNKSTTTLGKGGFGFIKLVNGSVVKKLVTNSREARIKRVDETPIEQFRKELKLAKKASNNNPYVGTYEEIPTKNTKAKYFLVETMSEVNDDGLTESGSDLFEAIHTLKTVNKSNVREIIIKLLKGLDSIHERGILHLDIKPENIWVFPDHRKIKYIDFGAAEEMKDNKPVKAPRDKGTLEYRKPGKPQFIIELEYDKTDDYYSLSITIENILKSITDKDTKDFIQMIITNLQDLNNNNRAIDALRPKTITPTP